LSADLLADPLLVDLLPVDLFADPSVYPWWADRLYAYRPLYP